MKKINFTDNRITTAEVGIVALVSAGLVVIERMARHHGMELQGAVQDLVYDAALDAGEKGIAIDRLGDDKKYRMFLKEEES